MVVEKGYYEMRMKQEQNKRSHPGSSSNQGRNLQTRYQQSMQTSPSAKPPSSAPQAGVNQLCEFCGNKYNENQHLKKN